MTDLIRNSVKRHLLLVMMLLSCMTIFAQTHKVSGIVRDPAGEPVIGVSVRCNVDAKAATITDAQGQFSITVPADASLIFTYVGYETQKVLANKPELSIVLKESSKNLDDVVVVGYGTQKKSDMTGAISQVKAADISSISVSNPVQALQGRVAGTAVMTNNNPGSSPTLRIRGSGSINASNDPLYVVDGFPLMNSNLNDINPNDIESIEVLKDASSSAIYGSRGANGVVIITTKQGSKGRNNLTFSSYAGIQNPARKVELLHSDDFVKYINDAYTYSTGKAVYTTSSPAPNYDTDWQDEIFNRNALMQEHSVSFDGTDGKTSYMLSGSIYNQDGIVDASGFDKYTLRSNLSHEFKKWLTVGTHLQISNTTQNVRDNATGDVFRFGWPTTPIKNPDGSWYYSFNDPQVDSYIEGSFNPVAEAHEVTDERNTSRVLGDVFAEFSLTNHLKFKTNFGLDLSNTKGYEYHTSASSAGLNSGGKGVGGQDYYKMTSKLTENILTYSNIWNDVHRFTATGVYSYQDYGFESLSIDGSGFANDATGAYDMSLADRSSIAYSSSKYGNKLISWTARASYAYKDKYMATVTGRYDGSSRFGENNKWGYFPSIGLGWRADQESFLIDNKVISNLKLRTSYGVTGNQEISNYSSLPQLVAANYVYGSSLLKGFTETIGNSNLKWEKTTQTDIGVDLGLWKRIDMTIDLYNRNTSDLLYSVPIPTTSGYSSILSNIGGVNNKGFEFSINGKVIDTKDFKWSIGGNLAKNKNKITELYGNVKSILLKTSANGFAQYLKVGQPVNGVYTRKSAGLIRTQEQLDAYKKIRSTANFGEEMYVDKTDDNIISTDDYVCIGSTEPDFTYGLSTNLQYKNLTLDIYSQGAHDYASVAGIDDNAFKSASFTMGYASNTGSYLMYGENQILNSNYAPSKYAYDHMWSESNPNGTFPRAGARDTYFSDRTNGHWSYFVIKNIKLGYDLSSYVAKTNWMKGLSVYVNAQNYVSFSNQRGYNPENGDVSYPWAKTLMFGINARF